MDKEGSRILIADIPGIISGAHQNKGLGLEFLRHIERTHLLLFVLDASGIEGRNLIEDFSILRQELALYNPALLEKPYAVLLNKIDLIDETNGEESLEVNPVSAFREMHPAIEIFEISALTGHGLPAVTGFLKRKLSK